MGLTGLVMHHHAIRMRPDAADETLKFYRDVLGLEPDPGAREIEDVPLYWLDTGNGTQVHVFGVDGESRYAKQGRDPFTEHVAFGLPDIAVAKEELDRLGVSYWTSGRAERQLVFLYDQSGNMIELHQIGSCRCDRQNRSDA
jgi:catechol 2,3-dioxygenase-like lactoylglutathione lyase family enzyme